MSKNEVVTAETGVDAVVEKKINATIKKISTKINSIERGYLSIIGDVAYLYDNEAFKITGHKNIYELCADKFGMSRGTVHNLLSIYERFGEDYALTESAKEMSLRQMLSQIKEEKQEALGMNNSEADNEDSEADTEDEEKKDKKRKETILDFDFNVADAWSGADLINKLSEEITETLIIPAGAKVIIKITS